MTYQGQFHQECIQHITACDADALAGVIVAAVERLGELGSPAARRLSQTLGFSGSASLSNGISHLAAVMTEL